MKLVNAERDSDWIGCIDFGTALSKICLVKAMEYDELQSDNIRPLAIAVRPGFQPSNPFLVPSVVFLDDDNVLFGEEAEDLAFRLERAGRQAFVSPKQYLINHDARDLSLPVDREIDPTAMFSAKELLKLLIAHLLERAANDATEQGLQWPVPLRIARPAWNEKHARHGEEVLKEIVTHGLMLVEMLGAKLSNKGGFPKREAKAALRDLQDRPAPDENSIFKLTLEGIASVKEATAVAAGSIRPTGRRIIVIADIGGGTSDFAAFMTGLRGKNVISEIEGSSRILPRAGDFLDMYLCDYILSEVGYQADHPAAQGPANKLRAQSRGYKERLFSDGRLAVQIDEDFLEIALEDFLNYRHVVEFSKLLRDRFNETLSIAVECAKNYPQLNGAPTQVEILFTGGGYNLPMVQDLFNNPSIRGKYVAATPEFAVNPGDADFGTVMRQMAVSIGGAMRDLPTVTPPVRDATTASRQSVRIRNALRN